MHLPAEKCKKEKGIESSPQTPDFFITLQLNDVNEFC